MTLMGKLMTGAGMLALSTGIAAAAPAIVQNDLNLRAGPGTDYEVIAAMPGGSTVDVMGCQASWCQVAFGGTTGFASRAYLGLGGGMVGAAPGIRTYGEGYAYRGVEPGYGYDEDTYAYGSYRPGYSSGYYGGATYGGSYGYSEGERRFGNERSFSSDRSFNNERSFSGDRRSADNGSLRSERRSSATTSVGVSRESRNAPEIKGNNPMKAEKHEAPIANAQRPSEIGGNNPMKVGKVNAAANEQRGTAQAGRTRGTARETTGAAPRENR